MNSDNPNTIRHSDRQKAARILSLLTSALCIVAVFLGSRLFQQQEGFPFGDLSGVSVEATKEQYMQSADAKDLIAYLKVLCYQAEVIGDEKAEAEIASYGTSLLDMARSEQIDLEELGDEDETLLALLKMIRSYGAK